MTEVRDPERLIGLKEVMRRTSLSRTVIYEKMQKGDGFPRQVRIGRRSVWAASEVDAWIKSMLAQRGGTDPGAEGPGHHP